MKRGRSLGVSLIANLLHFPQAELRRHYVAAFSGLFTLSVLLSLSDLWSTGVALKAGLEEGNYLLLALGNFLGLSILGALALSKIVFIFGTLWAAVYGIRTSNPTMRTRAFVLLTVFVVLLFFVSINNYYLILTE